MSKSKIEWTERTWNPTRGCSYASAGCKNCYAARQAHRFSGPGGRYEGLTRLTEPYGPVWTGEVREVPDMLHRPLEWKPCKVFVDSMSDLFHLEVSSEFIMAVFGVMAACRQHIFQVLTKRSERMVEWFEWAEKDLKGRHRIPAMAHHAATYVDGYSKKHADRLYRTISRMGFGYISGWPIPNVWLGVSVENQAAFDRRTEGLMAVPASIHWLSMEPLLGPIEIPTEFLTGEYAPRDHGGAAAEEPGPKLGWVVVGSESGPGARPMELDWVRSIRDQCQEFGVPFFFKQRLEDGKKVHMPELDGKIWGEYPGQ